MDIEIIQQNDGVTAWGHIKLKISNFKLTEEYRTLSFDGIRTGCGIGSMKGNISLEILTDEELEQLREYLLNINIHAINHSRYCTFKKGMIIATIGLIHDNERRTQQEEILFKLGFQKLSEYINPNETKNYENLHIQACYGLYPYVSEEYKKESKIS